ncbi:hypothetical protein DSO57_1033823 [Entomophthora muscae]|uniref:Uncharacterized protein n=1 Tax=Entomophthora muscae TaxID=34485 RepID=A0ACC2U9T6_9FUNG|nr:hypothetical protein DSO57_1033823 [Entomophthora muscae]
MSDEDYWPKDLDWWQIMKVPSGDLAPQQTDALPILRLDFHQLRAPVFRYRLYPSQQKLCEQVQASYYAVLCQKGRLLKGKV